MYRPAASIAAAAEAFLAVAAIEPGDRILTLMTGDSHAGLTTGMAAALAGGATLEAHAIFDSAVLRDTILGSPGPTHLVAPAWSEPALAQSGLPERVKSLVLVHRPPIRFEAKPALRRNVLDVLALDEMALVTRARSSGGGFARCLETAPSRAASSPQLRVRLSGNGVIELSGLAADIRTFGRYGPAPRADSEWLPSGYQADLFAGIAIGVS